MTHTLEKYQKKPIFTALGLMSGTSVDGIDLAVITTDGHTVIKHLGGTFTPYTPEQRQSIKLAFGANPTPSTLAKATDIITDCHIRAITHYQSQHPDMVIDVIGFHGQTTYHNPDKAVTVQIGDFQKITNTTGIPVVGDFRSHDMKNGGVGAPLAPVYHNALVKDSRKTAFLNLGGVGNITICLNDKSIAFDTGPANALMDDLILQRTGKSYDKNGDIARSGSADMDMVKTMLDNPYFTAPYPKALDRDIFKPDFSKYPWVEMSTADAMATLAEFTILSIKHSLQHVMQNESLNIDVLVISGGGMHNTYITQRIQDACDCICTTASDYGIDGDLIEAEAFAFMAVRSVKKLPLSYPKTTGVPNPTTGGVFVVPV